MLPIEAKVTKFVAHVADVVVVAIVAIVIDRKKGKRAKTSYC